MATRFLPTGIQNLREIRERDCYYIDKTGYALRMVREGKYFFLSRPRRFGKSLFLDTLKELFEGSEELFKGLRIHGHWDWSVRHPVLKLTFGKGNFKEPDYLHKNVMARLGVLERQHAVEPCHDTAPERFDHLIRTLHRRTGQRVVVLVDEYDKPILDAVRHEGVARANRNYLGGLYSTIKECDAHVRFCFLTGVSKFSKGNLFSGLSDLRDITLSPAVSAVAGYTEDDVDTVFAPELPGLDREKIRDWYNGYGWGGPQRVYNPFDLLLLFRKRVFKAWWFGTGAPTFLLETLVEKKVPSTRLDGIVATDRLLSSFDVGAIAPQALLFQAGYLTITESEERYGEWLYRLGYPNRAVRQSLNSSLLGFLVRDRRKKLKNTDRLFDLLEAADIAGLEDLFHSFFSSIPAEWRTGNDIDQDDGYYASVFYSYFAALGFDVTVEDSSGTGRLDMAVQSGGHVYLFEFKVRERAGPGAALAQLKAKGYADKYRHLGLPVHLVGVEFSMKKRNVAGFEAAPALRAA